MSTRLQVVVDNAEMDEYQRAARERGLTLSEWVRQTLRQAQQQSASGDVAAKLAAIRRGAGHEFPTADIDQMLAEIERGYVGDA
jgi:hypothetical protein